MNHKEGQEVRIKSKLHGHEFEIGEIVFIDTIEDDGTYKAVNSKGNHWWINDEECESIDSQERIKQLEESLTDMVNFSKTWGREWFNDADWARIDRARSLVETKKV